jgi:putative nucleotidyltransferase with HDIG domain
LGDERVRITLYSRSADAPIAMEKLPIIHIDQIRVGLYIHFDLHWTLHSFLSNEFKISSEKEMKELKDLPIETLCWDPQQSDVEPLSSPTSNNLAEDSAPPEDSPVRNPSIKQRRANLKRCEKAFTETVSRVRNIMGTLRADPKKAIADASEVIGSMVEDLVSEQETTLQLVNMQAGNESAYFHSINITTLCLMLARQMDFDESDMRLLGMGAMLHDIGFSEIPDRIVRKKEPLTHSERELYKRHPEYGLRIARKVGVLPREVEEIIYCHHENQDGSGYPKGIETGRLNVLTRMVCLVNAYDNLCNPRGTAKAMTPHEAVSYLFAKEKARYDNTILSMFISYMGVYPPGTLVRLSDGRIAMVISINKSALLKPNVMLYDAAIPKSEAPILDLREETLTIKETLRRDLLPRAVVDYLNLGDNLNYFFSPSSLDQR